MSTPGALSSEIDELRHEVREYQAALRSAAPRLAAFKRLEDLARDHGTSSETIASRAGVEVMKREKDALVTMLTGLAVERDQLKGEVAMLLINKTEASRALDTLQARHAQLDTEVAELVDRLVRVRDDATRLIAERNEMTQEISALRDEARALSEVCRTAPAHDAGSSASDAELAAEVGIEIEAHGSTPANGDDRREMLVPRRTHVASIGTDDDTEEIEAQAFDAFFHAEFDHDKSRDWILG